MMYSQAIRSFYKRSLHQLLPLNAAIRAGVVSQPSMNFAIYNTQAVRLPYLLVNLLQRYFSNGKKGKKGKKRPEDATDAEASPIEDPDYSRKDNRFDGARQASEDQVNLSQDLYKPFNLGDVKRIDSTPDHQVIF